mmetsp:Transcript_12530/g.20649  ORF Transcript_12530/g.20649 Transcript_12530/m.20649 type:complete len:377 (-) Transcript_12530:346-1476(-)|eukprot:CAMPEP_0169158306 /NCGR_PEP_ID=MMETSP1015-20121227/55142_1 /TAXON_ID=342587 /ORGANISM="Karlodinium micrum, Strain CCMP2283" /LENGTH=376 /DNA_ID=CAMNT_0009229489 /DNA_START=56 /DNA_END=1186 /DNA_ORIENTATION=-
MSAHESLLKLDSLATCNEGMIAEERRIDWSHVPHSQRIDRVLSAEETLRLSQKSNLKGFQYFFGNLLLMGLNSCVIMQLLEGPAALYPVLLLIILWHGFSICALGFAGQHECIHFTAFESIRMNKIFMFLASLPAFSFAEHEMLLHRDHHTFVGISGKDPELIEWGPMTEKQGFRKVPESISEYIWLFISLTWELNINRFRKLGYCAMGRPVDYTGTDWTVARDVNSGTPSIKDRLQWWARLHISFYVVFIPLFICFLGLRVMFWCWLLPWFVGPAPLWYIQIGEHADCQRDGDGRVNTRTVEANPYFRFVYWNMNYHAEHHLYPLFPFHQLHAAHELLKGHLLKSCDSFHQLHYRVVTDYIPKQIADEPVSSEAS